MFSELPPALQTPIPWVGLTLVLAALVATLRRRLRARHRSRIARRRAARAVRGERSARRILRSAGYRVVDSQRRRRYPLRLDGTAHRIEVRADYVVARRGRRYVAEVKTGAVAPSPDHAPTRRQLLEYATVFDVAGVVLVDAEQGRVVRVEFPRRARGGRFQAFFFGVVAAGLVVWARAALRDHVTLGPLEWMQ